MTVSTLIDTFYPRPRLPQIVLSTAYLPNIQYMQALLLGKIAIIDEYEHYRKQTYRNRCEIMTANGVMNLSIPLIRNHNSKQISKDICIDYSSNWQQQHWRAFTAAYKSSAFFDYYAADFEAVFQFKDVFLCDLNARLLSLIFDLLGLAPHFIRSTAYVELLRSELDLRDAISPKSNSTFHRIATPYYQVFTTAGMPFHANLSVFDLLCNEGPNSLELLLKESNSISFMNKEQS